MNKYEVEFAIFRTVEIEAENLQEAISKSYTMENEEIEQSERHNTGYMVWNDAKEIELEGKDE